jgi:hypothetical protein
MRCNSEGSHADLSNKFAAQYLTIGITVHQTFIIRKINCLDSKSENAFNFGHLLSDLNSQTTAGKYYKSLCDISVGNRYKKRDHGIIMVSFLWETNG